MSGVVAWLDSDEGREWSGATFTPAVRAVAEILTDELFSTRLGEANDGPVNPAHDPCGRPPT